jgi:hypothetical protein
MYGIKVTSRVRREGREDDAMDDIVDVYMFPELF